MNMASVAVVGCGYWGKNLVRNMQQLNVLHSVVDNSPSCQATARKIAPNTPIYERIEEVLSDPMLSGVMIATPAATHYEQACKALEAGKDVFVEKPITLDIASSKDLVVRAEKANRILMVGHLLEYHPAILKLNELIQTGE